MTEATNQGTREPSAPGTVPTGVEGLDVVLGGGLSKGAIYLVMGRPGAGKTTLGNQLCFGHVASGGRAVYLTLLTESHASMLKNVQTMGFFDASVLNHALFYVGGYRALRDGRLTGLLNLVRRLISDERATLLVIDGISPARAFADSDVALKEFIVELQMLGVMTNCTTVLLANMTAGDAIGPEHTMVDGLIEVALERSPRATVRTLEVLKLRGRRHLLGKHEMAIYQNGIRVYPRAEDVLCSPSNVVPVCRGRLSSGVRALDEMLDGGLLSGTTTVLLGFTGSGKTTVALQFLSAGAAIGENGLYFGFYEPPARLLDAAERAGLPLRRHTESGRFSQLWQPSYSGGLDVLAHRLLEAVEARHVRRLVIDGLDGFRLAAIDPDRTIRYLTALVNELRLRDVTTIITEETAKMRGPEIDMRIEGISALADNLIMLEYLTVGVALRRLISIIKQRGSANSMHVREFSLSSRGIQIAPDATSAEELLSIADDLIRLRTRKPRSRSGE